MSGSQEATAFRLEELLAQMSSDAGFSTEFGRRFEDVADLAILASPEYGPRVERIWRWENWPGATSRDVGIDRVIRTIDGELWAVQAKGYAPTTWVSKRDIDSFLAASATDQFALRLLVTSTNRLSGNATATLATQSVPVHVLDRSWLESLAVEWPTDYAGVKVALEQAQIGAGAAVTALKRGHRPLRPHQKSAVQEVVSFLNSGHASPSHDAEGSSARATLVMACGTGKTLTTHGISEAVDARDTLVLVPSLSLLTQTMREWQAQSEGRLRVLAVCSDPTVASSRDDDVAFAAGEFHAGVTTDPVSIAKFLSGSAIHDQSGEWPTAVFATYQSSGAIAEAQAQLREEGVEHSFELVVADEAHYLAGRPSKMFATVLDERSIVARNRVFATATPRLVSTRLIDALSSDGQDHGLVSMDDPALFGPVAHNLPFSAAIKQELISDYRLVILGIDDEQVASSIDSRALVELAEAGITTDAATVSAAIAVNRVIHEHGATRLLSYHSRVANATNFAALLNELPAWLPPSLAVTGMWADAISGATPVNTRRTILSRLADTGQTGGDTAGVVSNARCLTAGIDLPALSGVVFVDPRRSKTDIVQAVSRGLRLAANKSHALIVIPVAVRSNQDFEEALSSSAFEAVWQVLGALRDHDDSLAEELDSVRTSLGRHGEMSAKALGKVVIDLPQTLDPTFADAVRLRMVERLGSPNSYGLGVLQRYVEREGHARVPRDHREVDFPLGAWVGNKRSLYRQGKLSSQQARVLESFPGWTWDPFADRFQRGLGALQDFITREGHAKVPDQYVQDGFPLGAWVQRQRADRGRMSDERVRALEALPGWRWTVNKDVYSQTGVIFADSFALGLAKLRAFAEREGHSVVPGHHVEDGFRLGWWVQNLRSRPNRVSPERRAALEATPGWTWNQPQGEFERGLQALRAYAVREGNARVPPRYVESDGFPLGQWVNSRRTYRHRLTPERIAALEMVPGWTWALRTTDFEHAMSYLSAFVAREGHAHVPPSHMESGYRLGAWVTRQRARRGSLSHDRASALEALPGWTWSPQRDGFEQGLTALTAYVERHGHALVPQRHVEDGFALGGWVNRQRSQRAQLPAERIARLESMPGWQWTARSAKGAASSVPAPQRSLTGASRRDKRGECSAQGNARQA